MRVFGRAWRATSERRAEASDVNERKGTTALKPDPFFNSPSFLALELSVFPSVSLAHPSAGALASLTHGYGI